jgi:hypothetical protein
MRSRNYSLLAASVFALLLVHADISIAKDESVGQIKQQIIKQSIMEYPGRCPCPYNLARNGSRCGARSAYSKVGGHSPLCYPEDVTDDMVKKYRKQKGLIEKKL